MTSDDIRVNSVKESTELGHEPRANKVEILWQQIFYSKI
jgi:hypothetical protein